MPRRKKFSRISLLAALFSAAPGAHAQDMHSVYPSVPYQANQNFYPSVQQQSVPIQNPSPIHPNNITYPYQGQITNTYTPPIVTNQMQASPSYFPQPIQPTNISSYPAYSPSVTPSTSAPPMQSLYPSQPVRKENVSNVGIVNQQISPQIPMSGNAVPTQMAISERPSITINQTPSQQTKLSSNSHNKNISVERAQNTSTLDKLVSSFKRVPTRSVIGLFVGAFLGALSGKKVSGKDAVIGAIAGLAAGAACDHFAGDLMKSMKAIKEIWSGSSKQNNNKTQNKMPGQPIPLQTPVNPNVPVVSTPINNQPSPTVRDNAKPIAMDSELQGLVNKLVDLQSKYTTLVYNIKYSDPNTSIRDLSKQVSKIEDTFLRSDPAIKFVSEYSYCICDIRTSQIKSKSKFNFKEQKKIIRGYLSRIPTLYTKKDLKDLIPRVEKCLAKLLEFRKSQVKDNNPTDYKNENKDDKEKSDEATIDSKVENSKSIETKKISDDEKLNKDNTEKK